MNVVQFVDVINTFRKLFQEERVFSSLKTKYKLLKTYQKLEQQNSLLENARKDLVQKYGVELEKGTWTVEEENVKKFSDELIDIFDSLGINSDLPQLSDEEFMAILSEDVHLTSIELLSLELLKNVPNSN